MPLQAEGSLLKRGTIGGVYVSQVRHHDVSCRQSGTSSSHPAPSRTR
jgi:hypothetical protein